MTKHHAIENTTQLKIYLYFRLFFGGLLVALYYANYDHRALGSLEPEVFLYTLFAYIAVCILTCIFAPARKLKSGFKLILSCILIDISTLIALIHSSGGLSSGLGYLLLVFVAMGSIFIQGRISLFLAAFASFLVICDTIYLFLSEPDISVSIFASGVLGIMLFATALGIQFFTTKIQESNRETARQIEYAENLKKLAQAIITRMRTGVVVIDQEEQIELINDSALQLMNLSVEDDYHRTLLEDISPIHENLKQWNSNNKSGKPQVHALPHGQEVRISLASLDFGDNPRTVFYIEDNRTLVQQAQQLKLASLGRLTASIAHEVRNPLGAIAHAAQLLGESDALSKSDNRLIEIIMQHSDRVNQIIENTLVLSRRKEPNLESIDLRLWLPKFINEYTAGNQNTILFPAPTNPMQIKADTTHLSQILTNLCDNGARYSKEVIGEAKVLLHTGIDENTETVFLEIIDYGEGIPDEKVDLVFDPFYTTETMGSGLGLFISKELCEISQANLHYKRTVKGESCFRIDFAHYKRES